MTGDGSLIGRITLVHCGFLEMLAENGIQS